MFCWSEMQNDKKDFFRALNSPSLHKLVSLICLHEIIV